MTIVAPSLARFWSAHRKALLPFSSTTATKTLSPTGPLASLYSAYSAALSMSPAAFLDVLSLLFF